MDQLTGEKWFIHRTNHRMVNQSQSLKHRYRMSQYVHDEFMLVFSRNIRRDVCNCWHIIYNTFTMY